MQAHRRPSTQSQRRPWFRTVGLYGWLIAVGVVCAQPIPAQTVTGQVTHDGLGTPLTGVYVYLMDETGAVGATGLTDAEGNFILRASAAGRYDLHAELIGHAPLIVRSLMLQANAATRRDLTMAVRAIDLQAIVVTVENRCQNGPPAAPATRELWEAARTALRVIQWSQEQGALRFALVRTRRELDPVTLEVNAEATQTRSGHFAGSPYVALPAERLAEDGFITRAADGGLEYWAPDAAVLLSESFLANHCFRMAPPEPSAPTLVGLAFEPVSGRDVPEIEGVLWIDAASSQLRRLDYRYVRLPFAPRTRWKQVGGQLEFERLANGMWIVRRWRIRMPDIAMRRGVHDGASGRQLRLTALNEISGEVITVDDAGGQRLMEAAVMRVTEPVASQRPAVGVAPPPVEAAGATPPVAVSAGPDRVFGTVTGETGPAPGALIALTDSTGARVSSVVADEHGAFALVHPGRAGVYRLTAEHIGYATTTEHLTLSPGEAVAVDVRLATRAVPLGAIRVTARRQDFLSRAGFYSRMERGLGWFVDSEEIERRKPSRVTDLLRGASGVQVVSQGAFEADIRIFSTNRLQGDCPPAIYVDGLMARSYPQSAPPLTQLVDVSAVAAVEVLRRPSEIPPAYTGSDAACGVVLIWLQR